MDASPPAPITFVVVVVGFGILLFFLMDRCDRNAVVTQDRARGRINERTNEIG